MPLHPHVAIPPNAVADDVIDMDVVQDHYWPAGQAALRRYVRALAAMPVPPARREYVRLRTARLTGCTH